MNFVECKCQYALLKTIYQKLRNYGKNLSKKIIKTKIMKTWDLNLN